MQLELLLQIPSLISPNAYCRMSAAEMLGRRCYLHKFGARLAGPPCLCPTNI